MLSSLLITLLIIGMEMSEMCRSSRQMGIRQFFTNLLKKARDIVENERKVIKKLLYIGSWLALKSSLTYVII